jgi:hypothetical protein
MALGNKIISNGIVAIVRGWLTNLKNLNAEARLPNPLA